MNNLILSLTRGVIPYVKELREITGSVTACILMQQLDFWFHRYPKGFYKFIEPCNHPNYRKGDSWCEELGFSDNEYRSAYEKIGIRYKSKREYNNSTDKFQNKFYACYHDRIKNQIFYVRNHNVVDQVLFQLLKTDKGASNIGPDGVLHVTPLYGDTVNLDTGVTVRLESGNTVNPSLGSTETHNAGVGNTNFKKSIYRTNTTTENITDNSLLSLNKTMADTNAEREMINIWNKIVEEGANPINLTSARRRQLDKALVEHFNSNVSEWEAFCHLISASKWLMGESGKSTWKASIDWALLPANIVKIKERSYGIGDRKKLEKEHDTRDAEEEKVKSQIVSRRFDEITQKARGFRKEELLTIENSLDQQALEALKEEFQESIRNGSKGQGAKESFSELGWNMPFIDTIYQGFKEERLLASQEIYLQNAAEELGYDLNQMQHLIEKQFSKSIDNG